MTSKNDYKYNTNLQAIINKKGIVKETIYPNKVGIVIIEGESWSAISYDNEKIDKEEMVEVLKIEGVKAQTEKSAGPPPPMAVIWPSSTVTV